MTPTLILLAALSQPVVVGTKLPECWLQYAAPGDQPVYDVTPCVVTRNGRWPARKAVAR